MYSDVPSWIEPEVFTGSILFEQLEAVKATSTPDNDTLAI